MPAPENGKCYVFLSLDVDDQPTLSAFRECATKAKSLEEFVILIRNSIARNELFRVLGEEAVSKLDKTHPKHLFEIRKIVS